MPATIEENNAVRAEIDAAIAASEARVMWRMEERLTALELRMKEFITRAIAASEERLLAAMRQGAGSMEDKIRAHRQSLETLGTDLVNAVALTHKVQ